MHQSLPSAPDRTADPPPGPATGRETRDSAGRSSPAWRRRPGNADLWPVLPVGAGTAARSAAKCRTPVCSVGPSCVSDEFWRSRRPICPDDDSRTPSGPAGGRRDPRRLLRGEPGARWGTAGRKTGRRPLPRMPVPCSVQMPAWRPEASDGALNYAHRSPGSSGVGAPATGHRVRGPGRRNCEFRSRQHLSDRHRHRGSGDSCTRPNRPIPRPSRRRR